MKNSSQKQLLINFLLGICTEREKNIVEEWIDSDPGNVTMLEQTVKELTSKDKELSMLEKVEIKKEIFHKIEDSSLIFSRKKSRVFLGNRNKRSASHVSQDKWLKVAALVLVITIAGFISFYFGNDYSVSEEVQSDIVFKERVTQYGETTTLLFGDGSNVKLNSGSTLNYPEIFSSGKREVYLEGEAFFTIAEDESRPFIVHSGSSTTRVLGTSFNIRAYGDDGEIQVAVVDGRVAVSPSDTENDQANNREIILLEKNQWMTYRPESQFLEKKGGDVWEMIAWKDGVLIFNDKSFDEVVNLIERWYGVEITVENSELKDHILMGEHHDASLEEVLNSIQFALNFKYSINGSDVRIYKNEN